MPESATPVPQYRTLPFGEQHGTFLGVAAGSNRDDGFFSGENNYVNHTIFTGYRYQCVEYARRFLLLTTGCVFDECGRASEVFRKTVITHVETGEKFPFIAHENGKSNVKPEAGNIIIWPYDDDLVPWGHIGVISYVDDHRIGIAEQNQYFGSFVSPSPDYLGGERCVGRFLSLTQDAETGAWTIHETATMTTPLGWMSYPGAPRREKIHAELKPLPEFVAIRSTPMDSPDHPHLFHLRMPEPIELPCGGQLSHMFGFMNGCGQCAVASGTAFCRVVRFTLQFLFHRDHIGGAFLSLPSNPLHADIKPCPALDPLFCAFNEESGTQSRTEEKALAALAAYFGISQRWVTAMQREFEKGELHMFADVAFAYRAHPEDVQADVAAARERSGTEDDAPAPQPHKIRAQNPHDEVWQLGRVNFGTCKLMLEISQLAKVLPAVQNAAEFQLPGYRCYGRVLGFSFDFCNYLKSVEECRGPRTAFAIVLPKTLAELDGPQRDLVTLLQSYCEKIKYPVRVVAEADLVYDESTGKLFAHITNASPPISSPTTIAPAGDFEVNFVFALAEWEEILHGAADGHAALFAAATDYEQSDVVFAKPLWSYLATGLVHRAPAEEVVSADRCEASHHSLQPLSIRFYDIARRLYDYAMPRQAAETWDQEVSEFKDSCRRIGIAKAMPTVPPTGFVSNAAVVNFAFSATMSHSGADFAHDGRDAQEHAGQPAANFHLFPADAE